MTSEELRRLIAPHKNDIGGPITALRTLQRHLGWIDTEAEAAVADVFNLSRADVRGLVNFYADFRTTPPATHVLTVCQAEACQAVGARPDGLPGRGVPGGGCSRADQGHR